MGERKRRRREQCVPNNSERDEIRQRVANFKAHQQRFIRERKDYAASEWKRMLASQSLAKKLDTPIKGPGPSRRRCACGGSGWSKYQPPLERIHGPVSASLDGTSKADAASRDG